jgi:hypothetical protein
MSQRFGAIRQNGYVVPDLAAAMRHWAEVLGIGPWQVIDPLPVVDARYRGQPTEAAAAIALSYSGDLQIELIQPLNDAPSPYNDFLGICPSGGLQHVSSWPATADYDAARSAFTAAGSTVLFEGAVGSTRFVYLDTIGTLGTCFEMADLSAGTRRLFDSIRQAALDWDGQTVTMS